MTSPEPDFEAEAAWLSEVLTQEIPLGSAMALSIARLDAGGITLAVPLEPNVNDKGSAFGGAMASLMILAGWSLPRLLLRRHGLAADLVIGRCELRFVSPVYGPFQAECGWPEPGPIDEFVANLQSGRRARLALTPEVLYQGDVAATLEARYAALPR
ncbi:MAG: YiiD C-terminal domain-containing protein [Wenzhouxiangellaceae bacterium]